MATPVTRGELQDILGLSQQEARMERRQEIQAAVAPLATRAELHQGQEQLIGLVQQTQQQIQQTEQRLLAELARHTSAILEATRIQIKASTEPFDDLPGRVGRLETEVFGSAPRKPRTRRRRN